MAAGAVQQQRQRHGLRRLVEGGHEQVAVAASAERQLVQPRRKLLRRRMGPRQQPVRIVHGASVLTPEFYPRNARGAANGER
jgi:hypothetical protein